MAVTDEAPYKASELNESVEKEIERLRTQVLWSWDKEARNLAWFGLCDGMSILELGSGPGFVTEQLLTQYPHSHVTCVEIDPDLIVPAERYLQGRGFAGRYTIVEADLMDMGLPAATFDAAYGRFVFQHLRDPRGALEQISRLLKPGGKLVIHDIDIGLGEIYGPRDAAADAIEEKLHAGREQRGGNPRIGRELWRRMAVAGFVDLDLEAVAVHSDKVSTALLFPDEWNPGEYKAALDLGIITAADLETMHRAHTATQAAPDKYALFVSLMVCGQKAARD